MKCEISCILKLVLNSLDIEDSMFLLLANSRCHSDNISQTMRDPFSYSARWDSIGLDCSNCVHQSKVAWPDKDGEYRCTLHSLSLAKTIGGNGFKEGEWFCSAFQNDGSAHQVSIAEFETIIHALNTKVLYGGYGTQGLLRELSFEKLQARK